jgi:hypothetical protein
MPLAERHLHDNSSSHFLLPGSVWWGTGAYVDSSCHSSTIAYSEYLTRVLEYSEYIVATRSTSSSTPTYNMYLQVATTRVRVVATNGVVLAGCYSSSIHSLL